MFYYLEKSFFCRPVNICPNILRDSAQCFTFFRCPFLNVLRHLPAINLNITFPPKTCTFLCEWVLWDLQILTFCFYLHFTHTEDFTFHQNWGGIFFQYPNIWVYFKIQKSQMLCILLSLLKTKKICCWRCVKVMSVIKKNMLWTIQI